MFLRNANNSLIILLNILSMLCFSPYFFDKALFQAALTKVLTFTLLQTKQREAKVA